MATNAPLLDLTTLVTASHVRIDGTLHPLRSTEAMSIVQVKRLDFEAQRIRDLLVLVQSGSISEDDGQELARLLASVCRIVLDAPDDIHARLNEQQRLKVFASFLQLRAGVTTGPTGAMATSNLIGGNTSRASSGSTAAPRRGGSRASR